MTRAVPRALLAGALAVLLIAGEARPAHPQAPRETRPMSQTVAAAPDPAVAEHLAAYDRGRLPAALKEAAYAASLHDGEAPATPEAGLAAGRARLADWIAVLGRIRRDLDPDFDPDHPPPIAIVPPGQYGDQYAAGVNPRDVKDPEMRAAYVAAIEKNRRRLETYAADGELHDAQLVIRERAAASIADAHRTLGLPMAEIAASLDAADITPADRSAILAAAG